MRKALKELFGEGRSLVCSSADLDLLSDVNERCIAALKATKSALASHYAKDLVDHCIRFHEQQMPSKRPLERDVFGLEMKGVRKVRSKYGEGPLKR